MTDHAKELEELALTAFGSSADALLLRAATELRLLEAEREALLMQLEACLFGLANIRKALGLHRDSNENLLEEIAKLKAENARLQKLVDDCAPFLEDGETPEEGLCRYDHNYANLWHSIEAKN
mgnify:FL=1